MNQRGLPAIAAAMVLVVGLCSQAEAFPHTGLNLSPKDIATIERGDLAIKTVPVDNNQLVEIDVAGTVNAPVPKVWHLLENYDNYSKIFPDLTNTKVVKRDGNDTQNFADINAPWPLPQRWVLMKDVYHPRDFTYSWTRLDGTMKECRGSWTLLPYKGATLAVYKVTVNPDYPFFPGWLLNFISAQIAPQALDHLRDYTKRHIDTL